MTLEDVRNYANQNGLQVIELNPVVYDSFHRPIGQASYRLVEKTTGKIKTYGTLENLIAYFSMCERF